MEGTVGMDDYAIVGVVHLHCSLVFLQSDLEDSAGLSYVCTATAAIQLVYYTFDVLPCRSALHPGQHAAQCSVELQHHLHTLVSTRFLDVFTETTNIGETEDLGLTLW